MLKKLFALILTLSFAGCTLAQTSTIADDYDSILTKKEQEAVEKQVVQAGELITTISFEVKTKNREDFENGLIPWASIAKPETDIPKLKDGNKIVIPDNKTIVIDYPLNTEHKFELESSKGFSRAQLLRKISEEYYKIYEMEENSAKVKTIPADKRTTIYNRNQTDGKFGIWGHDIADLVLAQALVYRMPDGKIVVALVIES